MAIFSQITLFRYVAIWLIGVSTRLGFRWSEILNRQFFFSEAPGNLIIGLATEEYLVEVGFCIAEFSSIAKRLLTFFAHIIVLY